MWRSSWAEVRHHSVFSDPPYNIGLDYSKGISTQGKYKGAFTASKDKKSSPDYRTFVDAAVGNALGVATKDAHIFFWCDENFVGKMQEIFEGRGITNRRTCLWIKNNFNMTPQIAFNKVYEPCIYGTVGSPLLRKELKNLNEILNQNVESGNQVVDEIAEMINVWLVKTGQRAGVRASDAEARHLVREADEAMHEGRRHRLGFIRRVGQHTHRGGAIESSGISSWKLILCFAMSLNVGMRNL